LIQIVTFTCLLHVSGLYLSHPHACQYKNLTEEDIIRMWRPLESYYIFF